MFPLQLCGGKPLVAVTREQRYSPSRLRVNDDDDPLRGCQMQVGWVKIGEFQQTAGYISKMVQDRHTVSIKVE